MTQCVSIILAMLTVILLIEQICKTEKFDIPLILDGWRGIGICFAGSLLFLLLSCKL